MRWYYGWNVVGASMLILAFIFGSTQYVYTFWIDTWLTEFGATRAQLLMGMTMAQVVTTVSAPIVGHFCDSRSIKPLLLAGVVSACCGLALASLATQVWHIVACYAVFVGGGLSMAGTIPTQALAVKWFEARRGFAIGLVAMGTSIGAFLLPPLISQLQITLGWRVAHQIMAVGIAIILLPVISLIIVNNPSDKDIVSDEITALPETTSTENGRVVERWTAAEIVTNRRFFVPALAFLPPLFVFSSFTLNLGPLTKDLGFEGALAATFMSALALTMLMGKFAFGVLADRVEHKYLFMGAVSVMICGASLMMGTPGYLRFLVACMMMGLAAASFLVLMAAIIADGFGAATFGRAMGLLILVFVISNFGSPIIGHVRDVTGSYDIVFFAYVGSLAVSMGIMSFLPSSRRNKIGESLKSA